MTVQPLTVRMERLLPGPIERVWDYLTKPEFLATWLDEANQHPRPAIQRCEPPAVLEYAWNGDSTVRFDLEARGQDVLLRLTHRRLPACFIGVFTVLAVGLAFFTLDQPDDASRPRQQMGAVKPLYGMLGGRC
jgi:uncharacterized protein YndB with AHSA1/START domain